MINRPRHTRSRRLNTYNRKETVVHKYVITVTLTPTELTQLIRAGSGSVNLGISKLIQERNNDD